MYGFMTLLVSLHQYGSVSSDVVLCKLLLFIFFVYT